MADEHEDDYNSEEDEDYCPSEGSSDEDVEGLVEEDGDDASGRKRKGKGSKKGGATKKKKGFIEEDEVARRVREEEEEERRKVAEEQKKAEEEEKSSKINDLWAQLNAPTKPKAKPASGTVASFGTAKVSPGKKEGVVSYSIPSQSAPAKDTVTVTQKYDFAGETIEVTKTMDKTSEEYKALERKAEYAQRKAEQAQKPGLPKGLGLGGGVGAAPKRPAGGLDGLLSTITNKKKKMSTLAKSSLDWSTFKTSKLSEGEKEDMEKAKDKGYLDKQAFLNRADWRQFENERAVRDADRKKQLGTPGKS